MNLIPYNPVAGLSVRPARSRGGQPVRRDSPQPGRQRDVRKTKGRAIDAACGQLRRRLDQDATVPVTEAASRPLYECRDSLMD